MNLVSAATAIVRFVPAAVANAAPVAAHRLLGSRFPTPIDFGIKLSKHRIFGDGKTWRGLFSGVAAGMLAGFVLGDANTGTLLGLGAMLGDLVGSFAKRRLGMNRGVYAGLLDQIDFAMGALMVTWWMWTPAEALLILLMVPPVHRISNFLAHAGGMKNVPW